MVFTSYVPSFFPSPVLCSSKAWLFHVHSTCAPYFMLLHKLFLFPGRSLSSSYIPDFYFSSKTKASIKSWMAPCTDSISQSSKPQSAWVVPIRWESLGLSALTLCLALAPSHAQYKNSFCWMLGDLDRGPRYPDSFSCIRNMTQHPLTQSFWAPRAVWWLGDLTQSWWLSMPFKAPPDLSPHSCSDLASLTSSHWSPFLSFNMFPPLCFVLDSSSA